MTATNKKPKNFILKVTSFNFFKIQKIWSWSNIYRNSENQFHAEFSLDVEIDLAPGDNLL